MKLTLRLATLAMVTLTLGGCLAKTAIDVATAPVKVASRTFDLATTSQSETDEKRGREIRRREERLAKLDKQLRVQEDACLAGDDAACRAAVTSRREIDALVPTIPVEQER